MVITVRGAPTRPPPGAEIGEGGAEIVMATIFNFYLFSTEIDISLFGNDMFLFGDDMFLFGNDMFLFGNDMFLFGNDVFSFRK